MRSGRPVTGGAGQWGGERSGMAGALTAKVLDADDPGRGGGTRCAAVDGADETGVAAGADDSDAQSAEDVEDEDAVEDGASHARDVLARVLNLTSSHRDQVRASNRESSVEDAGPPTKETAGNALGIILVHGVATLPVSEPVGVVLGISADHCDERQEDEAENEEDLGAGKEEFTFSVPSVPYSVSFKPDCIVKGGGGGEVTWITENMNERKSNEINERNWKRAEGGKKNSARLTSQQKCSEGSRRPTPWQSTPQGSRRSSTASPSQRRSVRRRTAYSQHRNTSIPT